MQSQQHDAASPSGSHIDLTEALLAQQASVSPEARACVYWSETTAAARIELEITAAGFAFTPSMNLAGLDRLIDCLLIAKDTAQRLEREAEVRSAVEATLDAAPGPVAEVIQLRARGTA